MSHAPLWSNVTTLFVVKCLAVNCLRSKGQRIVLNCLQILKMTQEYTSEYLQRIIITTYRKKLVHFLLLF